MRGAFETARVSDRYRANYRLWMTGGSWAVSCRCRKAPHLHRHCPKFLVPGTAYFDPSVSAANSACPALVAKTSDCARPSAAVQCGSRSVAFRRGQPQASEQQFQGETSMKKRSVFFSLLAAAAAVAMSPALADEEGTILA